MRWLASFCTLFDCHVPAKMNSVSLVITANLGLAMLSIWLMIRVKLVKSRLLSTSPLFLVKIIFPSMSLSLVGKDLGRLMHSTCFVR